jgi:hypothetical protein
MRGTCGPYYYAKVRHGQAVRSLYLGRGETAHAIAALTDIEARTRAERREAEAGSTPGDAATAATRVAVDLLVHLADEAARTALYAAGYHQHRGQWRRKRGA